jgi:hypothetical protein
MKMPDVIGKMSMVGQGLGVAEGMISQQAAVMGYSNSFLVMTFVSLSAFPLLALIRSPKSAAASAASRASKDEESMHAVMD